VAEVPIFSARWLLTGSPRAVRAVPARITHEFARLTINRAKPNNFR
jgi:hypothetical protein